MNVLGWSGGPFLVTEPSGPMSGLWGHDSAAVLITDGRVVAACEQERIDRIKHSDKAPLDAIDACLRAAGLPAQRIERIAFGSSEAGLERALRRREISHGLPRGRSARATIADLFESRFQIAAPPITFVKHHLAHAASAYYGSGFANALVVTYDGIGEDESGLIAACRGGAMEIIDHIAPWQSLGQFYCDVIAFLGYEMFDEYKVMGLAPYGDAARFRSLFETFVTLEPEGRVTFHSDRILALDDAITRRISGTKFTQEHSDVAAALQEALECAAFYIVEHAQKRTNLRHLALAGGVAHNCTLNGKLLRSGLFDSVYVQPASHDAGCALGAAMLVAKEINPIAPMPSVALGLPLLADDAIGALLARWSDLVSFERSDDIARDTARALARGEVFGWAQGRSEFGPRALGQRSIVADPRPAANKARINEMVKKREGYRPFAPSVLAEDAHRFFDLPEGLRLPFMTFVVNVRPESRELLGAITHVDGTARVQTVAKEECPLYWDLIRAFGDETGVPMVLNTSFNNHREPIVDSAEDALICFLTTGLEGLSLGSYLVRKKANVTSAWLKGVPSIPKHMELRAEERVMQGKTSASYVLASNEKPDGHLAISEALFRTLRRADGVRSLADLIGESGASEETMVTEFLVALTERKLHWFPN